MAAEIAWRHSATGKNVYTTIRNATRQYWNTDTSGPAFESLTVLNWYNAAVTDGNYWIVLTETPADSYFYVGTWPALLSMVGWYWLDIYERVGATPAISDTLIGGIIGYWNGTTLSPWAADAVQVAGTAQTARDIGASVLLSSGSGAGQLDFTSGVVKANLAQILGTALTETGGYLAAGFKKFFNIETPVSTVASSNQTGDSYPIVSHTDYGNAKLVRSATPANALVVDASGLADANAVKVGPSGSGVAQTAGNLLGVWTPTKAGYLDDEITSRAAPGDPMTIARRP